LTKNAMTGIDVCRMMKRRLKSADLPGQARWIQGLPLVLDRCEELS
jgi:hypothetical protein